jgi:hypothetical protein
MAGIRIKTTGIDEAHYLAVTATRARVFPFPDGLTRHITLKNWQWEVLDRLQRDHGYPPDGISDAALKLAAEFCENPALFEAEVRKGFAGMLRINMAECMGYGTPPAND